MPPRDFYAVLGVPTDADNDTIKRAYRKLARRYHPDVSSEDDAESRFKEIQEAYAVLRDADKRAAYDQWGSVDGAPPPDWDPEFSFQQGGFRSDQDFSDFFSRIFGAGAAGSSQRGRDIAARIDIELEDAWHGHERQLTLNGSSASGERTIKVRIPRGIQAGQHIRLAGQGMPGDGTGAAGDLLLEVGFRPHALFTASGRDISMALPITPWEAALGAKVRVPTLGGTVEMQIPQGSRAGQTLRIRGKGLPGTPPGDQFVRLEIHTPAASTPALRECYQRLATLAEFDPREALLNKA